MYNFSYSSLFPKPYCPQCGFGLDDKGQCTNYQPNASILQNAALYTSGNCPYGHIQLPGTKQCTSLLTGAFRAPTGFTVINNQITQTGYKPKVDSCCGCE
jgi:hypothetical protein